MDAQANCNEKDSKSSYTKPYRIVFGIVCKFMS